MYSPANVFLATGPVPVRILYKAELPQQTKLRVQHQNHLAIGVLMGAAGRLCTSPEWGREVHLQRDGDHQPCPGSACILSSSLPQPGPLGKFGIKSPFFFPLSFLFDLSLVLH